MGGLIWAVVPSIAFFLLIIGFIGQASAAARRRKRRRELEKYARHLDELARKKRERVPTPDELRISQRVAEMRRREQEREEAAYIAHMRFFHPGALEKELREKDLREQQQVN